MVKGLTYVLAALMAVLLMLAVWPRASLVGASTSKQVSLGSWDHSYGDRFKSLVGAYRALNGVTTANVSDILAHMGSDTRAATKIPAPEGDGHAWQQILTDMQTLSSQLEPAAMSNNRQELKHLNTVSHGLSRSILLFAQPFFDDRLSPGGFGSATSLVDFLQTSPAHQAGG